MKLLPRFPLKTKFRHGWHSALEALGSAMQVILPGGGAAICFAVGKFVAGFILVMITVTVVMRLLWRRRHAERVVAAQKMPVWATILSFVCAFIGSAVLVEAVKLPVRFDQPRFSMVNWLIVIAAIWFIHQCIRSLLKTWLQRPSRSVSPIEKQ
jgi:amino acid transporter